jgi:hypothetical protein
LIPLTPEMADKEKKTAERESEEEIVENNATHRRAEKEGIRISDAALEKYEEQRLAEAKKAKECEEIDKVYKEMNTTFAKECEKDRERNRREAAIKTGRKSFSTGRRTR